MNVREMIEGAFFTKLWKNILLWIYIYTYEIVITKALLANYDWIRNYPELWAIVTKITNSAFTTIARPWLGVS